MKNKILFLILLHFNVYSFSQNNTSKETPEHSQQVSDEINKNKNNKNKLLDIGTQYDNVAIWGEICKQGNFSFNELLEIGKKQKNKNIWLYIIQNKNTTFDNIRQIFQTQKGIEQIWPDFVYIKKLTGKEYISLYKDYGTNSYMIWASIAEIPLERVDIFEILKYNYSKSVVDNILKYQNLQLEDLVMFANNFQENEYTLQLVLSKLKKNQLDEKQKKYLEENLNGFEPWKAIINENILKLNLKQYIELSRTLKNQRFNEALGASNLFISPEQNQDEIIMYAQELNSYDLWKKIADKFKQIDKSILSKGFILSAEKNNNLYMFERIFSEKRVLLSDILNYNYPSKFVADYVPKFYNLSFDEITKFTKNVNTNLKKRGQIDDIQYFIPKVSNESLIKLAKQINEKYFFRIIITRKLLNKNEALSILNELNTHGIPELIFNSYNFTSQELKKIYNSTKEESLKLVIFFKMDVKTEIEIANLSNDKNLFYSISSRSDISNNEAFYVGNKINEKRIWYELIRYKKINKNQMLEIGKKMNDGEFWEAIIATNLVTQEDIENANK